MRTLFLAKLLAGGMFVLDASADTLAYQGDLVRHMALINEINSSEGVMAYTYDNFIVPAGQTWDITGLFSNNLSRVSWQSAFWDIRSGVSAGDGGVDIASGTSSATDIATGRQEFGYDEFQAMVSGLNLELTAGTYWLAVAPISSGKGYSYISPTDGAGGINSDLSGLSYLVSPPNYVYFEWTRDWIGYTPGLSMGVVGTVANGTPEPASFALIAGGLGLIGLARKRLRVKKSL